MRLSDKLVHLRVRGQVDDDVDPGYSTPPIPPGNAG